MTEVEVTSALARCRGQPGLSLEHERTALGLFRLVFAQDYRIAEITMPLLQQATLLADTHTLRGTGNRSGQAPSIGINNGNETPQGRLGGSGPSYATAIGAEESNSHWPGFFLAGVLTRRMAGSKSKYGCVCSRGVDMPRSRWPRHANHRRDGAFLSSHQTMRRSSGDRPPEGGVREAPLNIAGNVGLLPTARDGARVLDRRTLKRYDDGRSNRGSAGHAGALRRKCCERLPVGSAPEARSDGGTRRGCRACRLWGRDSDQSLPWSLGQPGRCGTAAGSAAGYTPALCWRMHRTVS